MNYQKLYNDSFFPPELITHTYGLDNVLLEYDKESISCFTKEILKIIKPFPEINAELLTWSLQVVPHAFIIEDYNSMSSFSFIKEIINIYKEILRYPYVTQYFDSNIPFKISDEEHERFQEIILLQLSLLFSAVSGNDSLSDETISNLGQFLTKLARFILMDVVQISQSNKVRIIATHLILGAANAFIDTEFFAKFISIAFDCMKHVKFENKENYNQFNRDFYDISSFKIALRKKLSEELKNRARNDPKWNKEFYEYMYSIIDTHLVQPYKHYAFVDLMEVYLVLFEESKGPAYKFIHFDIEQFMQEFESWFDADYILEHKPSIVFNFLAFGNTKEDYQCSIQKVAEKEIMNVLSHSTRDDLYDDLPEMTYHFLIGNPAFLSDKAVIDYVLEYIQRCCSSIELFNRKMVYVISMLHSVSELIPNMEDYQEKIFELYDNIVKMITSSYKFNYDVRRAASNILLSLILLNAPETFWKNYKVFAESKLFSDCEEIIFPYAAVSTFVCEKSFRNDFNLKDDMCTFIRNIIENNDLKEEEFKSLLVNIFTLAMGTSFIDSQQKFKLHNKFSCQVYNILNIIDEASSCGLFSRCDMSQFIGKKSIDFSTQNTLISVVDDDKLIIRNSIGAMIVDVKYKPPKCNDSDYFNDEELMEFVEEEEGEEEKRKEEEDEMFEGSYIYLSKDDFTPYVPDKENKFSDAMKFIKSTHLFRSEMNPQTKHITQENCIFKIDAINPTPSYCVNIAHIIDGQNYTTESTPEFETFKEFLKNKSLDPLCNFKYVDTPNETKFHDILVIFKENRCYIKESTMLMREGKIVISVTLISKEDSLYEVEMLNPVQIDSNILIRDNKFKIPALYPFFNGMKWLVKGSHMASIIAIISYFSLTTKPDFFFQKFLSRMTEIGRISTNEGNAKLMNNNNVAVAFYDLE